MTMNESLAKATQTANLLASDLLAAYSNASALAPHGKMDGILAILLRQLLADARSLESRLLEIETVRNG